jgi:hypothetical protein
VIRLSGCAWPPGWFIHKFTAITTMAGIGSLRDFSQH